jgi:hypothetical protein
MSIRLNFDRAHIILSRFKRRPPKDSAQNTSRHPPRPIEQPDQWAINFLEYITDGEKAFHKASPFSAESFAEAVEFEPMVTPLDNFAEGRARLITFLKPLKNRMSISKGFASQLQNLKPPAKKASFERTASPVRRKSYYAVSSVNRKSNNLASRRSSDDRFREIVNLNAMRKNYIRDLKTHDPNLIKKIPRFQADKSSFTINKTTISTVSKDDDKDKRRKLIIDQLSKDTTQTAIAKEYTGSTDIIAHKRSGNRKSSLQLPIAFLDKLNKDQLAKLRPQLVPGMNVGERRSNLVVDQGDVQNRHMSFFIAKPKKDQSSLNREFRNSTYLVNTVN